LKNSCIGIQHKSAFVIASNSQQFADGKDVALYFAKRPIGNVYARD
jgi:hypothetical protein